MTQVITNDVSAIVPELWSKMVQVPLYKSLVALEIADMKLGDYSNSDTIHIPRFGNLSATTYTAGTTISAVAKTGHMTHSLFLLTLLLLSMWTMFTKFRLILTLQGNLP